MTDPREPVSVRVPASTSNLGAGFDCVGLAVDRFLDARWEPGPAPLVVERPPGDDPLPGADLLAEAFAAEVRRDGADPLGVVRVRSSIPVGKGLGSSAAALVAGRALASAARGRPIDRGRVFAEAARREGHGDNAAPATFGGLVAVVRPGGAFRAVPLELAPTLGFAWAAPPGPLSTREARRVLPASVDHGAAVDAIARMAALLRGLAGGDAELLGLGFEDVALHAPWRLALVAAGDDALRAAREAGAWGATVSGAGSGLLAVGPRERMADVADAMGRALAARHGPAGVLAFPLEPVLRGVERL